MASASFSGLSPRHRGGTQPTRLGPMLGALLICLLAVRAPADSATRLDDFTDLSGWTATASEGASIHIDRDAGRTGGAMRLSYDLGAGGFVMVRKAFDLTLPANYAFTFDVRGVAADNHFEFKLVDHSGGNVWWYKQRHFEFPADWRTIVVKQRRLQFAWGPVGGGSPRQITHVEFAVAAAAGGRGTLWLSDFRLEPRAAVALGDGPPAISASSASAAHDPERALDDDPTTAWKSLPTAAPQWVQLEFPSLREYGGLVIDWDPDDYATAYDVQASGDGEHWHTVHTCARGNGRRDYIYLADGESRFLRLDLRYSSRGQGYGIRTLTVKPFEFSASINDFFEAVARDAPIGLYPKYFSGMQTYWTVAGVSGGGRQGLLNEEGMLEVDKDAFSLAPFLATDGVLHTWNTVRTTPALADGYLPIPSVTWETDGLSLSVTAFAAGPPGESALYATYRIVNHGTQSRTADLYLAIVPFQVVPPWQSLNMVGGATPIREIVLEGRTAWVNQDRAVMSLTAPTGFGAASFEEGAVTDFLQRGALPTRTQVSDHFGYASGALHYHRVLPAGGSAVVDIAVPFHDPDALVGHAGQRGARSFVQAQRRATLRQWEHVLGRVELRLPPVPVSSRPGAPPASHLPPVAKSTEAYMLIARDGPAIMPGVRTYARSWIRDGAMISTALLQMGRTEEVRDFIRWYARYQLPDGRVPCCVDARGADRVPEHDSNGQLIYAVAEYYRFTRDAGFAHEMWPVVLRAVHSLEALRAQRMTEAFTKPDTVLFYGLLPESISHEGYSSRPVHSYWDDFFALRGLKDAAMLAMVLDDEADAARIAAVRDAFRRDLYASIDRSMAQHGIDYIPGAAELGDFDATSTAIAVTLADELGHLPDTALRRTFDKYWEHVEERERRGPRADEAYTPYELRNVAAFIRMGQRDRALELLGLLLAGQRPAAWNHWAEVVWRDASSPRFIGDMPHTWIGSDFIQALRTAFVYERESDRALVLAAGLAHDWVIAEGGVGARRLPTHYGTLSYSLRRTGDTSWRTTLSGDLTVPPGGIVLQAPFPRPVRAATVNGKPVTTFSDTQVTIHEFPADVMIEF